MLCPTVGSPYNPISAEMPAMRTGLLANFLIALQRNERREETVGVFEIGRIFQPVTVKNFPSTHDTWTDGSG